MIHTATLLRLFFACCLCLLAACYRAIPVDAEKPSIFVTLAPQAYLVEKIMGDRVEVQVLVGRGQNAENYQPLPRQLVALDRASVYFSIGMPFEQIWIPKLRQTHPQLEIVEMRVNGSSPTGDPHYWTDPLQALKLVHTIRAALAGMVADSEAEVGQNSASLKQELMQLDGRISALMAAQEKRRFLVYHPAWTHFADRYDLEQVAVERDGKEPGVRYLATLRNLVRENNVRAMLVQPQTSSERSRRLADDLGVQVVIVDPLEYEYVSNLWHVAQSISQELW